MSDVVERLSFRTMGVHTSLISSTKVSGDPVMRYLAADERALAWNPRKNHGRARVLVCTHLWTALPRGQSGLKSKHVNKTYASQG